ncbi:hypothetical protein UCDDS831_g02218 [Diplodia seriata]|uniref:Uncharacterized protein n=1 Tax=Diplodia seriata TaxID=420778 RepID=A0A0G2GNA2_9PEZI|nr:hypothetical protein UCDDS831_g02218 [Diplodia seriata]
MNPVAQYRDYEQWAAQGANHGQTIHLAAAAVTTAPSQAAPKASSYAPHAVHAAHSVHAAHAAHAAYAAQAAQAQQLSGAQVDDDNRHHTYYYRPRSDNVSSSYYYEWPRGAGQYYGPGYGQGYNNPYSYHHNWFGRTASEVYRDNVAYAMHPQESVSHRGQEMVPRNPEDGQMFYVKELDGGWTQRTFNTIENDLQPGYWTKKFGRCQFIRTRD